jgi:hypothetical protein
MQQSRRDQSKEKEDQLDIWWWSRFNHSDRKTTEGEYPTEGTKSEQEQKASAQPDCKAEQEQGTGTGTGTGTEISTRRAWLGW